MEGGEEDGEHWPRGKDGPVRRGPFYDETDRKVIWEVLCGV